MRHRPIALSSSAPFALALLALAAVGCDDVTDPDSGGVATLTLDAADTWAFARFDGEDALPADPEDPTTSTEWDLAFYATAVMLNGGAAGPGGVEGYCLCANFEVSDGTIMGLTAASQLGAFEAVSLADLPTDEGAWQADVLSPAIEGWWLYSGPPNHTISAVPEAVWYVRTASGTAYAKLHVTDITDAAMAHAGTVTLEWALQPTKGAAFEETETLAVDLSTGPVYLDLETASPVTSTDDWDLWLEGYTIRVNGGVSGNGQAGAGYTDTPFEDIEDASAAPDVAYAGDAFGGVFDEFPWFRYNLTGSDHQIWPTYDVYLLRKGEDVYKVQVTSYYGPAAQPRQITFRYQRLQ